MVASLKRLLFFYVRRFCRWPNCHVPTQSVDGLDGMLLCVFHCIEKWFIRFNDFNCVVVKRDLNQIGYHGFVPIFRFFGRTFNGLCMNQNKPKEIDFWAIILIDGEKDEKEEEKKRTKTKLEANGRKRKRKRHEVAWNSLFCSFFEKSTSDFILKSWSMVCNWYKHKQSNAKTKRSHSEIGGEQEQLEMMKWSEVQMKCHF